MTRALPFALASALAVTASAAPIPAEDDAAKLGRAYGRWTDPDKDCRYKLAGDVLTISLPEKVHYFAGIGPRDKEERDTAPTVLRDVTGDFTAVVRVTLPRPAAPKTRPGIWCVTGGLLVRGPNNDYYSTRAVVGNYAGGNSILVRHVPDGLTAHSRDGVNGPVFVRIRREGSTVWSAWGGDGKEWRSHDPVEVRWPATVTVGVVAENTLGVPAEVTFDRYSLTQPKKGPEATP